LTIHRRGSCCGHGVKVVKTIVELRGIHHHRHCWLGRWNVVGTLVGRCMRVEAPAAGSSGEPRSIVAKRHQEGGGVVGGGKRRACSQRSVANGT
jgi:hypothetical protein